MKNIRVEVNDFFDYGTGTWTYIVHSAHHKSCVIIDSVLDYDLYSGRSFTRSADVLIDFIQKRQLKLEWILETHIHADHLTAAAYIKSILGGSTGVSRNILKILETWKPIFQDTCTPDDGSQFDMLFQDGDIFSVGDMEVCVMDTPGHTPADVSYIMGDAVFVGDTLLLPDVGTGRCDFPGGDAGESYDSCLKILNLSEDYRIYVGHDYPPAHRKPQCMTTVKDEKISNTRIAGVSKTSYTQKRNQDDFEKSVPKLLFPAIQVNLRSGDFGEKIQGMQYVKIPVNIM